MLSLDCVNSERDDVREHNRHDYYYDDDYDAQMRAAWGFPLVVVETDRAAKGRVENLHTPFLFSYEGSEGYKWRDTR